MTTYGGFGAVQVSKDTMCEFIEKICNSPDKSLPYWDAVTFLGVEQELGIIAASDFLLRLRDSDTMSGYWRINNDDGTVRATPAGVAEFLE